MTCLMVVPRKPCVYSATTTRKVALVVSIAKLAHSALLILSDASRIILYSNQLIKYLLFYIKNVPNNLNKLVFVLIN